MITCHSNQCTKFGCKRTQHRQVTCIKIITSFCCLRLFVAVYKLVNPRRACAARVTVVGCVCVCLSVCVSVKSHLTSEMSNRAIKEHAYLVAYERQKICGDLPETTAFESCAAKHERKSQYANYSDLPAVSFLRLTHSEGPEGTQRLSTTFSLAQNDAY